MGDERERATMSAKAKRRTRAERACEGVMREKSKREEKDDYDEEKQEKRSQKIEKMRKKYLITSLFPFLSLSLSLSPISCFRRMSLILSSSSRSSSTFALFLLTFSSAPLTRSFLLSSLVSSSCSLSSPHFLSRHSWLCFSCICSSYFSTFERRERESESLRQGCPIESG